MKIKEVFAVIEKLAPLKLAYQGDPTGFQLGDPEDELTGIVLSLNVVGKAVREAKKMGANLLISHHPLFFKPLQGINLNTYGGRLVSDALKEGITIYSAHTNLDISSPGVTDSLAEALGISANKVLYPTYTEKLYKVVVFVPLEVKERVLEAVAGEGAGVIGNYSHCSFQLKGTGTFKPLEGAEPYSGKVGVLEYADEYRLEFLVSEFKLSSVIKAMVKAHCYEEVAYDIYTVANEGKVYGFGRIGSLADEVTLRKWKEEIEKKLGSSVQLYGNENKKIKKIALSGGSGGLFIEKAYQEKADVFVVGELKYHELLECQQLGLEVIQLGHGHSEVVVVPFLKKYLSEHLPALMKDKVYSLLDC